MTFAAVYLGEVESGALLMALPSHAETLWPGTMHPSILDTMGGVQLSVVLSEVPRTAVAPYDEEALEESQIEDFWADENHVGFGTDVTGLLLWPDYAELAAAHSAPVDRRRAGGRARASRAAAEAGADDAASEGAGSAVAWMPAAAPKARGRGRGLAPEVDLASLGLAGAGRGAGGRPRRVRAAI